MNEDNNPPGIKEKDQLAKLDRNQKKEKSFFTRISSKLKFYLFFKNKTVEESVEEMIDGIAILNQEEINQEEKKMIKDLVDFYDTVVDEIKIPRNEIIAIEKNNFDKIFDLMNERKTSRIIVYQNDLDNIIGFVTVKDLFVHFKEYNSISNAQSLIKNILFAPPSMKAFDLLTRMKKTKIHIAAIIDEYGGTDGIVTINNIISEIVGVIDDNENQEILITQISPNEYELSGRAELDELKELYKIDLYKDEYGEIETINGLILSISSSIPSINEIIKINENFEFLIKDVSDRMVLKALLRKKISNL
jgi:magnesium and cobalt transporter